CGHGSPPPPRHSRYSGARRPATGSAPTPASGDLLATRGASLLPDIPPSHLAGTCNPIRPRPTPVCCLRHQQFCRVGRVPLPQLGEEPDFFALGHAWWYVTPHMTWEAIALVEAEIDPYTPPLELDDTQRRRLMDDAYPYALIDHFALTDPELLERVPPADRYRFFHDCMRMAAGHGIRDASKLVMVCTWALLLC